MTEPISEKVNDGYDVYQWPEFKALMTRLGCPETVYTRGITIRIHEGEVPLITHEYIGSDTTKPAHIMERNGRRYIVPGERIVPIDTTTMLNTEYRTHVPPSVRATDPAPHVVLGGEG